jgi:adenylate cyclase
MALFIYALSAWAASLFIEPTGLLSGIFAAIATGDYRQRFEYEYDNELGELATATNNMVVGLKERQMLGKFVSTTFDNQVASATAQTSAQKLTGVILFSDVRSFTTHSEANPPVLISQMLNQHLRGMVEAINSNGGRVDQFIGDAVVAFFPGEGAGSCLNAVRAAAAMMRCHHRINAERKQRNLFAYDIGIGLAYGTVIAGALSSGNRSEFTIIGNARTLAEQLEAQSKSSRHTAVIASASLTQLIPEFKQYFSVHTVGSHELLDLKAPL